MSERAKHWDSIFSNKADQDLGWYESDASQTLKYLEKMEIDSETVVFLPGAGTSILVDELHNKGCKLILNDISEEAINKLRQRIGNDDRIKWLHHDISQPLPKDVFYVDAWIDRAVLHFLLGENEIQGYFSNLHSVVRPGGYALLAEFSEVGAPKCAGLELHRYSIDELTTRMGAEFELISHEEFTFMNPFGEARPYIYGLYKRNNI